MEIGKTGYPFVFDDNSIAIIHPTDEGKDWSDQEFIKPIMDKKKGIVRYHYKGDDKVAAFDYFPDFGMYIAATMEEREESRELINRIIASSVIIGIIILIILSLFTYFTTTDNVQKFLNRLKVTDEKLISARQDLEMSNKRFQTIFDNSNDQIFVADFEDKFVEVNKTACETLAYSREEMFKMHFADIKSKKYLPTLNKNTEKIKKEGHYIFESEHITKEGKIIPVEISSRVVDFNDNKYILNIARDITERKEVERKILSTVIQTEERERERGFRKKCMMV